MIFRIHGNKILPMRPAHPGHRIVRNIRLPKNLQSLGERHFRICEQGFHSALASDLPYDLPRVNPGDPRDPEFPHGLPKRPPAPEIRGHVIIVPHDKASDGRPCRLEIIVIDPVVSDERVGHDDELVRVGRVREDLLIADRGGVEDQLRDTVPLIRAEPVSYVFTPRGED